MSKILQEISQFGLEIGDMGLFMYYRYAKCRLSRCLSLNSYHESLLKMLQIQQDRTHSSSFLFPCRHLFEINSQFDIVFSIILSQFSDLKKDIPSRDQFNIKDVGSIFSSILQNPESFCKMPSISSAVELLINLPLPQFSQFNKIRLFTQHAFHQLILHQFPEFSYCLRKRTESESLKGELQNQLPITLISHSQLMQSLKYVSHSINTPLGFTDDPFTIHYFLSCFGNRVSHYFKAFNPDLQMFPFDSPILTLPQKTSLVALILDRSIDTFYLFKYYSASEFFMITIRLGGVDQALHKLETLLFELENVAIYLSISKSMKILQKALKLINEEVEPMLSPLIPFLLPRLANPKMQELVREKTIELSHKINAPPLLLESILCALVDNRVNGDVIEPFINYFSSKFRKGADFSQQLLTSVGQLRSLIQDKLIYENLIYIPDYTLANFQIQIFKSLKQISIFRLPSCSFLSSQCPSHLNFNNGAMFVDASVNSKEVLFNQFKELNWEAQYVSSNTLIHKFKNSLLSQKKPDILVYGGHGSATYTIQFHQEFKDIQDIRSAVVLLSCHPMYYQDYGPVEGFSHCFNFLLKQCPLMIGSISVVYHSHAQIYLKALKEELIKKKEKKCEAVMIFEEVKKSIVKNYPPLMMGLPLLHNPVSCENK